MDIDEDMGRNLRTLWKNMADEEDKIKEVDEDLLPPPPPRLSRIISSAVAVAPVNSQVQGATAGKKRSRSVGGRVRKTRKTRKSRR